MPCRLLACYEAEVDEVKIDLGGMGRGDYPGSTNGLERDRR